MSAAMSSDIPATINKRIKDIFAPYDIPLFNYPCISALLRQIRKHDAMRVIKTWVNSWATSYRMHEPVLLPCLFGCIDSCDQFSHYVTCPILFALQTLMTPQAPQDPLERIGLVNISRGSALAVSCTFAGYHAVRRAIKLSHAVQTLPDQFRSVAHTTFVDHFWTASLDAGLPCLHERLAGKQVIPTFNEDGSRGACIVSSAPLPLPPGTHIPDRRVLPKPCGLPRGGLSYRLAPSPPPPAPSRPTAPVPPPHRYGHAEAPGTSTSRASRAAFVPAEDTNAQNPLLNTHGVSGRPTVQ